jgi:hypothetical protein
MRTSILTLAILTLSLGLVGCGGAGGLGDGYIGFEDGQHFGDDSWLHDPIYNKGERFVRFPFSEQGAAVQAGAEVVTFQRGSHELVVRGAVVPAYSVLPTGAVLHVDQIIGHVVYTVDAEGIIGTSLLSLDARLLELRVEGEAIAVVATDAALELAPVDRAPRNERDLPVAQPAS